ncbi:Tn3 family transposase [Bacillus mycoides]|uniref:Tn3 family transposase n=1 Tax=Bacillus mycoides TaxID=1405 RepID=UPI003D64C849
MYGATCEGSLFRQILWYTTYLDEVIKSWKKKEQFDEKLLKHISLLEWEQINFLGEYQFSKKEIPTLDSHRSL